MAKEPTFFHRNPFAINHYVICSVGYTYKEKGFVGMLENTCISPKSVQLIDVVELFTVQYKMSKRLYPRKEK